MADVITFKDVENMDLSMEGTVLVIKVDLATPIGQTKGGNTKFASSGGIMPMIAGDRKVRANITIFE